MSPHRPTKIALTSLKIIHEITENNQKNLQLTEKNKWTSNQIVDSKNNKNLKINTKMEISNTNVFF